jgi:chromosome segregation ATPase
VSATLEQRVAALESGELSRLRGLAQRRLERLRQEREAVADLRERLDAARAEVGMALDESDKRMRQLLSERADHEADVEPLRVAISAAPGASASEVIAAAVEEIGRLREFARDVREVSGKGAKEIAARLARLNDVTDANARLTELLEQSREDANKLRMALAETQAHVVRLSRIEVAETAKDMDARAGVWCPR